MIRRISSLALGLAVTLAAVGALAQGEGDTGGGDTGGGEAAPAGGEAAPAGGEAAPAGGETASASAGGEAATASGGDMGGGKKNALGVDAGVLIPIGNFSDVTSIMIGGVLKYEMGVTPNIGVTGRVGFFYGLSKSIGPISYGVSDLPVWVGGRYYFMGGGEGAHAGVEIGLNDLMTRVGGYTQSAGGITINVPSVSHSDVKFGLNIPVGYKIGDLDIQAQYSLLDIGHAGDTMAVGVTVGYNFLKF